MRKFIILIICSISWSLNAYAEEVPREILSQFHDRGCKIAEYVDYQGNKKIAITKGAFSKTGNTDWAALCIEGRKKALLVIWQNEKACVSAFEVHGEYISTVDEDWMQKHIDAYSPNKKYPPLDHEGINIGVGMASSVYYCNNKRWYKLPGAD
jgi:hypothetical protein